MAQGHLLDANTFALWRLDETADPWADVVDQTGRCPLSTGSNVKPDFWGPAPGYGRRFSLTTHGLISVNNSEVSAALVGEWTWEGWVYLTEDPTTTQVIMTYSGGTIDSSANPNFLCGIHITASNRLAIFWEFGTGSDVDIVQTLGDTLPVGFWVHIAVIKRLNGGLADVDILFNGVVQQSFTGITNATNGTTSFWTVGHQVGSGNNFKGVLKEVHISKVARSVSYVLADAQRSDQTHIQDSNTLNYWKFNETPDFVDVVGEHHLTVTTGLPIVVDPLIQDGGRAKYLDGDAVGEGYNDQSWLTLFQGSWTFETWFKLGDQFSANTRLMIYGGVSTTASTANHQAGIDINSNGAIRVFWESGSGANRQFLTSGTYITSRSTLYHLGVRKNEQGGTATVDVFVNGVLVESSGSLISPDGGTGATSKFYLGGEAIATQFIGRLDDTRLSNIARSDAEILDSYLRGRPSNIRIIVVGGL